MHTIEIDFSEEDVIPKTMEKLIPLMLFPKDQQSRDNYNLMSSYWWLSKTEQTDWISDHPDMAQKVIQLFFENKNYLDIVEESIDLGMFAAELARYYKMTKSIRKSVFLMEKKLDIEKIRDGGSKRRIEHIVKKGKKTTFIFSEGEKNTNKPKEKYEKSYKNRTIEERWAKFKSVAHLWVSFLDNTDPCLSAALYGHNDAIKRISFKSFSYFILSAKWYRQLFINGSVKDAVGMYDISITGADKELLDKLTLPEPPSISREDATLDIENLLKTLPPKLHNKIKADQRQNHYLDFLEKNYKAINSY